MRERLERLRMLKLLMVELPLRAREFVPVARAAVVAVPAPDAGGRAAGADTGSGARPLSAVRGGGRPARGVHRPAP
jgi:hypothetical protein